MFVPIQANFQGSTSQSLTLRLRLPRLIELTFCALALLSAGVVCVANLVSRGSLPWSGQLALMSASVLVFCVPGMWLMEQAADHPVTFMAVCYRLIQERLEAGPGGLAIGSNGEESREHAWAGLIAEGMLRLRRFQAGRILMRTAAQSINLQLQAGRDEARQVANILREDGAALADAASGIMVASARLADDTRATQRSADVAEGHVSAAIERAAGLAAAARATTHEIQRMTSVAISASETAFAGQRCIASLDSKSETLARVADQVGRALEMAARCGQAASFQAARVGGEGRLAADLAADMQQMSASAEQALIAMQETVTELRSETGAASRRMSELAELIHHQHQLGDALGHAVMQQGDDITEMLDQLSGAHTGLATLRAGVEAVTRSGTTRLAGAEAIRGAADRLPSHADAIASILRSIPDFAPPPEF